MKDYSETINIAEEKIGIVFKNKDILLMAFSHSSYVNENTDYLFDSNERLEFLGDAVIELVTSNYIYNYNNDLNEGNMTKIRAMAVCESSLMECSINLELDQVLLLGKGEELSGGRKRSSILADVFEAVIGAIYLDSGYEIAAKFIEESMSDILNLAIDGNIMLDFKSTFQEFIQKNLRKKINYVIANEAGPQHNKIFTSQVLIENKVLGTGTGKSKKEAEQNAAKEALSKLK